MILSLLKNLRSLFVLLFGLSTFFSINLDNDGKKSTPLISRYRGRACVFWFYDATFQRSQRITDGNVMPHDDDALHESSR